MATQPSCPRCGGRELTMTDIGGGVVAWRSAAGEVRTWFCPHCDWGDDWTYPERHPASR